MRPATRQYYVLLLVLGSLALLAEGCDLNRDINADWVERQAREVAAGNGNRLAFEYTTTTDALLGDYRGLSGVKEILIHQARLSNSGVAEIPAYPELEHLHLHGLYNERLQDPWLEALKACPKLKSLEITEWQPPLFSVAKILELPHLRKLSLEIDMSESEADSPAFERWIDKALADLRGAKQLEQLILGGRVFSNRGETIDELQKELPDCDIKLNPPHNPGSLPLPNNVGGL